MGKFGGFTKVKLTKPQKSSFDLTHERRMTVRPSDIVPILCTECVPSDKFSGSSEILTRLAPLLAPIYEQVLVYVHYYFIPNRLLWVNWEEFITGGRLGVGIDPVNAPVPPYFDIKAVYDVEPLAWAKNGLADYLGCPLFITITGDSAVWANKNVDAMPFIAYQKVWYNYYRDRNFTDDSDLEYEWGSGLISDAGWISDLTTIRQRLYMKDYFTSALPFTQRGEEVLIPVSVMVDTAVRQSDGVITGVAGDITFDNTGQIRLDMGGSPVTADGMLLGDNAASTINDFRSAYALQVWLERNAVGGSRYTESTQAHFGVRPQDSRLQRPEYIGGGRINVKISEVVSTSYSLNDNDDSIPLGNMGGHGVAYGDTNKFNYFCTEHGFIIGVLSIMVPPSYHQGLPRMFRRRSFLDYPWPTFAKLGEQTVEKFELYAIPANMTEDVDGNFPLFGYQSRYADWKFIKSSNHGDFHDSLLFWTGTLQFADTPTLGVDFLTPNDATWLRWFAVDASNYPFWLYVHNKLFVSRPLPYFGTPNTLGFS